MGTAARHTASGALLNLRCILGFMSYRVWLVVAAILAALLTLSCSSAGTKTKIGNTAEAFYRALVKDPPRAYTYLSSGCQNDLTFVEFAANTSSIGTLLGESEPSVDNVRVLRGDEEQLEVTYDVVVHTNGQTVTVLPGSDSPPTTFVKEDGDWRFDSCDALTMTVEPSGSSDATIEEARPTQTPRELAVEAEADDSDTLPGQYVDLPAIYGGYWGRQDGPNTAAHAVRDIDYVAAGNTNPPAGGPHWGNAPCGSSPAESPPFCGPVPWGIYRTEWDAESLVHNMEHGGVIVWYNTLDRDVVAELETLIKNRLNESDLIVMAPYLEMEDETIALTSWSRIDKFSVDDYSPQRVITFLDAHVRRFNPEGL